LIRVPRGGKPSEETHFDILSVLIATKTEKYIMILKYNTIRVARIYPATLYMWSCERGQIFG
jgi:hypothetical protein